MDFGYCTGIRGKSEEWEVTVYVKEWPVSREYVEIREEYLDGSKTSVSLAFKKTDVPKLIEALSKAIKDPPTEAEQKSLIAEIEALTPTDIKKKLLANGIGRGSGWKEYKRAKKLIFQEMWFEDSEIYEKQKAVIIDYLGI